MESVKTLARTSKKKNRLSARKLKIGREAAEIAANHFILEHLPDRFCAGVPNLVEFPLGFEIDVSSPSALCRTDANGTSADDLVHAANQPGFQARKEYRRIQDVQKYLNAGIFPILYVNLLAIDGLAITHALVLEVITQGSVTVFDPWRGRRKIASHPFTIAWEKIRHLAVLVQKQSHKSNTKSVILRITF